MLEAFISLERWDDFAKKPTSFFFLAVVRLLSFVTAPVVAAAAPLVVEFSLSSQLKTMLFDFKDMNLELWEMVGVLPS